MSVAKTSCVNLFGVQLPYGNLDRGRSKRFFISALLLLLLLGCSKGVPTVERELPLMGTWAHFTIPTKDLNRANKAIDRAIEVIQSFENATNFHDDKSELHRLNIRAASETVHVSGDLWNILQKAWTTARKTDGAFDPTIAPLVHLWGVGTGAQRVPSESERRNAQALIGLDFVIFNETERSVRFTKEGVMIDLGAIGKGYAVDKALEAIRGFGFDSALIQAGGSINSLGRKNAEQPWKIGVQHPRSDDVFYSFPLENGCVATSGDYQNYFEQDGARYHHVLNPATGLPVKGSVSATVIAVDGAIADAYATAAMVWSDDPSILQRRMDSLPQEYGLSIFIILPDGKIVSRGLWQGLPAICKF